MRPEAAVAAAPESATGGAPRLSVTGLTKEYTGVRAVDNVSLQVLPGEILGLVGHNGAGKSTLGKVLAGLERADAGTIAVDGREIHPRSARDAVRAGVGLVPQRLAVVRTLSVRDNITLGQPPAPGLSVEDVAEQVGLASLLDRRTGTLSPAMQRETMIARALVRAPRIVIVDEATAAFSVAEVDRLFATVRKLASRGISIIYVSHRLAEVIELSHRVVAMAQGAVIADRPTRDLDKHQLADLVAGRHVEHLDDQDPAAPGDDPVARRRGAQPPVLSCRGVSIPPKLHGIDLEVRPGEIVGLTGLIGSGRTTLLNALWGIAGKVTAGDVHIRGKPFRPRDPRHAIRSGIAYLPEDRARTSIIAAKSVRENMTLPSIRRHRRRPSPLLARSSERAAVEPELERLAVSPEGAAERTMASLSGGNQQKVLLARWLLLEQDLLLFDEPTEGVDIAGREDIYGILRNLAGSGIGVLISSSDIEEVVDQCDRVLVLREGTIAAELAGSDKTADRVSRACIA